MQDVIALKCCREDLDRQKEEKEESNEDPERDPEKNLDSENIGGARVRTFLPDMISRP